MTSGSKPPSISFDIFPLFPRRDRAAWKAAFRNLWT